MSLRIYVEGGGNISATKRLCRAGFAQFFNKALGDAPKPQVIACGGRGEAFDMFQRGLEEPGSALLLVDSEGPVTPGASASAHLARQDKWTRPRRATDEQIHLMVQRIEAWFLADPKALALFYGNTFNRKLLKDWKNVELLAKKDVLDLLKRATKGTYDKGSHGFELLQHIDPVKVREKSPHAERLWVALRRARSR